MSAPHGVEDARTLFTLRDGAGETQQVVACGKHAREMPLVDGEMVTAESAEQGCQCEFCEVES